MNIVFDTYQTLALASFVLLLGFFLVKRIRFYKHSISLSLLLAALLWLLH